MGKLKKEVVDEIRRLGEEGYSIAEIVDRVDAGRDSVRKYLVSADSSIDLDLAEGPRLSEGITRRLYDLQGILSASSIADAVERAYRDELAAMKFKFTLWEIYGPEGEAFSIDGMVRSLTDRIRDLELDNKIADTRMETSKAELAELMERSQGVCDEAYEAGYEMAKQDYAIFGRCSYCDKPIPIEPMGATHATIRDLLSEVGWGHTFCINQVRYESERGSRALRAELMR